MSLVVPSSIAILRGAYQLPSNIFESVSIHSKFPMSVFVLCTNYHCVDFIVTVLWEPSDAVYTVVRFRRIVKLDLSLYVNMYSFW